ncbi:MAG TPA: hypothetical protein VF690_07135 [Hymenobacter sp.]|jgi:hypothetical protein
MKKQLYSALAGLLALALLPGCNDQLDTVRQQTPDRNSVAAKDHTRNAFETQTPPALGPSTQTKAGVSGAVARPAGNNSLGMWLWYLSSTGYSSHTALAQKLASTGVKRIYVKVADGGYNATAWPEVNDRSLVAAYKNAGLEVWAWAYNYPGNNAAQAQALTAASAAGYQGFVSDVEIEFDGKTTELRSLFQAFSDARAKATTGFKLYCTSWGNPRDHGMRVDIIDQYVDAHMPQTYLEVWGQSYMSAATQWVNAGTKEYRDLGCSKPVHHILSTEKDIITSAQLNEAIRASGAETSIWRIPGTGTPLSIWNTLQAVDWTVSLGSPSASVTVSVPSSIRVGQPATFSGTASAGIVKIIASVDGYVIKDMPVTNGTYSFSYTFNQAGQGRRLNINAFNSAGTSLAQAAQLINVNP